MSIILIDTCVITDLSNEENEWYEWCSSTLENLDDSNSLIINHVIYAESSVIYPTIEEFNEYLSVLDFSTSTIPREALFLAGKAFLKYRKNKGTKCNVLPDFFIGAHAAVNKYKLMTRDKGRFSTYFPTVELIIPNH
ncbi:MAG: type II toxin-antitoxin system VapC family toxin [Gammaproteobacteria bacterium]|nr:type II toxin-antitoxin system VapC family toxin [Gammaproteobacteria bacterium]